jgi:hypothetical protein
MQGEPDEPPEDPSTDKPRRPDEPYTRRIISLGIYVRGQGNRGFPPAEDYGWVIHDYEVGTAANQWEIGEAIAAHWNAVRKLPLGFEASAIGSMMIGYYSSPDASPSPLHWNLSIEPPAFVSVPDRVDQDAVLAEYRVTQGPGLLQEPRPPEEGERVARSEATNESLRSEADGMEQSATPDHTTADRKRR